MNSDYNKRVSIESSKLIWEYDEVLGIYKKLLSVEENKETAILKIDTKLSKSEEINSVEILVLDGVYKNEFGEFSKGTYLRLPKEKESEVSGENAIVFRKKNYFSDDENVIKDTTKLNWTNGHGNLKVISLHENAALVYWPKDEVFIPHSHWGGEEILVLRGVFMDEHGEYSKGCWTRSPHMSEHYPFVKDESVIFVKTGHLLS